MSAGDNTRRRRILRWLAWGLFPVLVLAEVAMLQLHLPIVTATLTSQALTYFTPMALALAGSLWLSVRFEGYERWFWGVIAFGTAAIIVTESYWAWYQVAVDFRGPPLPHWIELGHVCAMGSFFSLALSMTELGDVPLFARMRLYLDLLGGLIVEFAVLYWFWVLPIYLGVPGGGWSVAVVVTLFPVCATVVVGTTVLMLTGWKATGWSSWERIVTFSFTMYALGFISIPFVYLDTLKLTALPPVDGYYVVIGAGLYLLFMAAVYRATEGPGVEKARPWSMPETRLRWLPVVYPTALATALVAIGAGGMQVAGRPGGMAVVFSAALLAIVLILRSWLSSVELAHHRAQSITDPVSGAYNQRYLYERLAAELDDARADGSSITAIAFDVIDFRDIVKMWGPEAGDRVLAELVDIVRGELGAGATVYRVGRDEFVAVVARLDATDAVGLARRVNARMGAEVIVEGAPVAISAGVAVFPLHAEDAGTLVSHALASQQLARAAERPDVVVYDAEVVEAADPLERLGRARRQSHRAKLRALAAAVDARDSSTRFHSQAVAELASAFALVLELSESRTHALDTAAAVHDIGKIGVPDEVLLKIEPLTGTEWVCLHAHCDLGVRLLAPAEMPEVLPIVRHHHERWDGTGYPDGLAGSDIPVEARMLAICDAFEAMTSGRRWRSPISTAQALAEIERGAGTHFDPRLAETFARMVVRLHGRPIASRMPGSAVVRGYPSDATTLETSLGFSARVQPGTAEAGTPSS